MIYLRPVAVYIGSGEYCKQVCKQLLHSEAADQRIAADRECAAGQQFVSPQLSVVCGRPRATSSYVV